MGNAEKDTETKVYEVRKAYGESQEEFSAKLGISKRTLGYAESGERDLSCFILDILCRTYHVTPNYMMGYDDDKDAMIQSLQDENCALKKQSSALERQVEILKKDKDALQAENEILKGNNLRKKKSAQLKA